MLQTQNSLQTTLSSNPHIGPSNWPDVMDVVEDTAQLVNTNESTNDKTDDEETE